jgi:hypothetical protein
MVGADGTKAATMPMVGICWARRTFAPMLRLFGLDHTRLTIKVQGRDFRLTDVLGAGCRESHRVDSPASVSEVGNALAHITYPRFTIR